MIQIFSLLLSCENKHWGEKGFWRLRDKHSQWDAKRIKLAIMLEAKSHRIQTQNVPVSTVCFHPFVVKGVRITRDERRNILKRRKIDQVRDAQCCRLQC